MFTNIPSYCRFFLIALSFVAMLSFLWRARSCLKKEIKTIPPLYFWGLSALILTTVLLYIFFITGKHVIDDELYYQGIAKNILATGDSRSLPKSGGWVFLLTLGFLFTGINNTIGIHISQFLGAGEIIGIFFLAFWAGFSLRSSMTAAALFTFVPARIFWASTGETHTAALFFVIWAMAFSFLLCRTIDRNIFWLAISFWIFAALVRSEMILLFIFFLIWIRFFIPKEQLKNLPFPEALFWSAVILAPHIIFAAKHAFTTPWNGTEPNAGPGNLIHNTIHYGIPFLAGKIHPPLLSVAAVIGLMTLYKKNKKLAAVLAGWWLIVSVFYFSLWFGNYGNTKGILLKTALFTFFYPPIVLCAALGLGWLADKWMPHKSPVAAGLICAMIILWSFCYYKNYPLRNNAFTLQMRLIEEVKESMSPGGAAVTCYPESFTGSTASFIRTMDIKQFLDQPPARASLFKNFHRVYLIDDIISQRRCQDFVDTIKKEGKAALVKEWIQGKTRYGVYSLSPF